MCIATKKYENEKKNYTRSYISIKCNLPREEKKLIRIIINDVRMFDHQLFFPSKSIIIIISF